MKFYAFIFLLIQTSFAYGAFNQKYSTLVRSFPSSFFISSEIGYDLKVWGNEKTPLYGYIRPSLRAQSSLVVNSYQVSVDLFPVSFSGFYIGKGKVKRSYDRFQGVSCDLYECKGVIDRDFIGYRLGLAYKKVFTLFNLRYERLDQDSNRIFYDEQSNLLARAQYDQKREIQALLGIKISGHSSIGLLSIFNEMKYLKNRDAMYLLFYKSQYKGFNYIAGSGLFKTRDHQKVGTLLLLIEFKIGKTLKLL